MGLNSFSTLSVRSTWWNWVFKVECNRSSVALLGGGTDAGWTGCFKPACPVGLLLLLLLLPPGFKLCHSARQKTSFLPTYRRQVVPRVRPLTSTRSLAAAALRQTRSLLWRHLLFSWGSDTSTLNCTSEMSRVRELLDDKKKVSYPSGWF